MTAPCLTSHEERSRDFYSTRWPFSFLSKEKEEVLNRDEEQMIFNNRIVFCPDNLPDQCLSQPGLRVCWWIWTSLTACKCQAVSMKGVTRSLSSRYIPVLKRCLIALQTGVNWRASKHWLERNQALTERQAVPVTGPGLCLQLFHVCQDGRKRLDEQSGM